MFGSPSYEAFGTLSWKLCMYDTYVGGRPRDFY